MLFLLTGATGFLGPHIARKLLLADHELNVLTRDVKSARETFPFPARLFTWDPQAGLPPPDSLDGVEAVIHLAGESVAGHRWTFEQKKRILNSRVLSTRNLREAVRKQPGVRALVSASAIGIYGDRGEETLSEQSAPGSGFLAEVCQRWEAEIFAGGADAVRTAAIRTGIVLGREGGALARLAPLFRLGVAGPVGGGRQWMSWIHVEDLASVYVEAITNDSWRGPINAVAPRPVTNAAFSTTLGKVLHRPAFLPAPAWGLKFAMGEMASIVLDSQRVEPRKLKELGFHFEYDELSLALSDLCAPEGNPDCDVFSADQWIDRPVEAVFAFFADAKNLETITPPWMGFQVTGMSTPQIQQGTLIDYRLKVHGVPMSWRTLIEEWEPNRRFVDNQLRGPYSRWHHTHSFHPVNGGTLMRDRVLYRLPLGVAGRTAAHWKVRRDVEEIFRFRKQKIETLFPSRGSDESRPGFVRGADQPAE